MKCKKVDLRKVNFKKSATWNIWYQFGLNIDITDYKLDVTKHYMPQAEQTRLVDYMIDNNSKLKAYKLRSKTALKKSIPWEVLAYFPSSVK